MNWRAEIGKILDQRDDDIAAMHRNGMTMKKIGAAMGLSHVAIFKILRKRGAAPRKISAIDASARLAARIAEVHPERIGS